MRGRCRHDRWTTKQRVQRQETQLLGSVQRKFKQKCTNFARMLDLGLLAIPRTDEGLSDLSEPHRQVIQLRFLGGLSVREVADRLDKSEAAVVALTKRALEALRQGMDRLGDFTRGG